MPVQPWCRSVKGETHCGKHFCSSNVLMLTLCACACMYMCCVCVGHGWWNRSGRSGNCRTNVCSMVPERLADTISEVINSKFFSMLCANNRLLGRWVSLISGLKHMKQTMEFMCNAIGPLYTTF